MTIDEIKIKLLTKIIECNDRNTLLKIEELLNEFDTTFLQVSEQTTTYQKSEKFRDFNSSEKEKIDKALQQYENGECISDEDAQKEIRAWLED